MFTIEIIPGFVMGIREGLEAFLIVAIMLEYLNKTKRESDKKYVYTGLGFGLVASILFGLILFGLSKFIGDQEGNIAKLWEFAASFVALVLITTFIYFMLKHKDSIVGEIKNKISTTFSSIAIITLTAVMVAREGAEISLFVFAATEQVSYFVGTLIGVILSGVVTFLIYKSLIRVNLRVIFNITLIYLILQAGFMFGYSFHELFSWLKAEAFLEPTHWVYTKAFDLSDTFLYHKDQPIGIFLFVTIGWYSTPEILQFIIQYLYTGTLLYFFFKISKKKTAK
jgi:high-affinity iron transporter